MTSLRTAAFAALVFSSAALQPAAAMPVANLAGLTAADVAKAEFTSGDSAGRLDTALVQGAAKAAAASYFDFDAIVTLCALALAGGATSALAVVGARRREEPVAPQPAWRESVFRAVQADLAAFIESHSCAA